MFLDVFFPFDIDPVRTASSDVDTRAGRGVPFPQLLSCHGAAQAGHASIIRDRHHRMFLQELLRLGQPLFRREFGDVADKLLRRTLQMATMVNLLDHHPVGAEIYAPHFDAPGIAPLPAAVGSLAFPTFAQSQRRRESTQAIELDRTPLGQPPSSGIADASCPLLRRA